MSTNYPSVRAFRHLPIATLIAAAAVTGCARTEHTTRPEYRSIGAHDQSVWRDNEQAAKLIEDGKYDRAEDLLKRILTRDAEFGPAHNNLGLAYYHQNKLYQAAWEYETAARQMPHHPEPRNNLGLVHERVDRLDDAIEQFQRAHDLEPDNVQYLANLTRAKVRRGDNDEATRKLLRDLVLRDSRPKWRDWARERLVLMETNREESAYRAFDSTKGATPTTAPTTAEDADGDAGAEPQPATTRAAPPKVQILPLEPRDVTPRQ